MGVSPSGPSVRTVQPTPVGSSPLKVSARSRRKQPAGVGLPGAIPAGGAVVGVAIGNASATTSIVVGVRSSHSVDSCAARRPGHVVEPA